jgi:hypothetical protein
MRANPRTGSEPTPVPRRNAHRGIAPQRKCERGAPDPLVRAQSLKAAIVQLREMTDTGQSSGQALAANLTRLRALGVDEEILDLVVEMVLAQNVDEEMTAAVNYLVCGFLLALLAFREEACDGKARDACFARTRPGASYPVGDRRCGARS